MSDLLLVKNPFMMNSKTGKVRFGTPEPNHKKVLQTIPLENHTIFECDNPKLNYIFGEQEIKEIISTSPCDYEIPCEVLNKNSKVEHTQGLPVSFLQIKTEEEGLEWYRTHYPKLPEELLPVIARYHWGEPMTKKALKNEKKKIMKKKQYEGVKIVKKDISITFD
tara:strand:+ start:10363 stop:10857 length:495 start_codon:yes stop_codon:yes gene_type:complete